MMHPRSELIIALSSLLGVLHVFICIDVRELFCVNLVSFRLHGNSFGWSFRDQVSCDNPSYLWQEDAICNQVLAVVNNSIAGVVSVDDAVIATKRSEWHPKISNVKDAGLSITNWGSRVFLIWGARPARPWGIFDSDFLIAAWFRVFRCYTLQIVFSIGKFYGTSMLIPESIILFNIKVLYNCVSNGRALEWNKSQRDVCHKQHSSYNRPCRHIALLSGWVCHIF